jgi:Lipocalin-like domain
MKLFALAFFLLPPAFAADDAATLQKKFVGSWKLVSIEGPNRNSSVKSVGMLTYDATGHMSVHIVRGDRPAFPNGRARATDKEKAAALDTYTAYYGTYTFEPENGIVIHHLEGSITPGQIGQDNIRYFELDGTKLTLSVANDGKGGRLARKDTTSHLYWEKITK